MTSSPPVSAVRWLTGIACFMAVSVLGVLGGGVAAIRAIAMSGMGVDQISMALGGAMAGGIAGVVIGVLLALRLQPRGHLLVATLALAGAVAMLFLAFAWQARIAA